MRGPPIRVLGAVLAGGGSRRFGRDKAAAPLAGRPMAGWVVSALRGRTRPVLLVGGDADLARRLGVEAVPDRRPGRGPLAGLETALERAADEGTAGVLVVACDLPLVTRGLLAEILAEAGDRAVVPEGPGGLQPLCAFYPLSAREAVRRVLDGEEPSSMHRLLETLPTRRLDAERLAAVGDPAELLRNVNAPEDAVDAAGILRDRERPGARDRGRAEANARELDR